METKSLEGKTTPKTAFELTDVSAKGVVITGIGILVGLGVIVLLIYPVYASLAGYRAAVSPPALPNTPRATGLPPQPRIQSDPRQDLKDFRAYENSMLNSYQWVDRSKGIVSIPIGQAMRLIAQRGIPPQKAPAKTVLTDPSTGTRLTGFEDKVEPQPR